MIVTTFLCKYYETQARIHDLSPQNSEKNCYQEVLHLSQTPNLSQTHYHNHSLSFSSWSSLTPVHSGKERRPFS